MESARKKQIWSDCLNEKILRLRSKS